MKMFKKIMAVALTAVMAVSMLTGCAVTDAMKKTNVLKAMGDVATAACEQSGSTVTKVKFEEKSNLNTKVNSLVKNAKAEDVAALDGTVSEGKYLVATVKVKSDTLSVSNFKDLYAHELLGSLMEAGNPAVEYSNNNKTATIKAGVKVDSFKNAENKTEYYAIVLVEKA